MWDTVSTCGCIDIALDLQLILANQQQLRPPAALHSLVCQLVWTAVE